MGGPCRASDWLLLGVVCSFEPWLSGGVFAGCVAGVSHGASSRCISGRLGFGGPGGGWCVGEVCMESGGSMGCGWISFCRVLGWLLFVAASSLGWLFSGSVGFGWPVSLGASLSWLSGCSPILPCRCLCFVRMCSCRLWAPFCLIVGTPSQWWVFRLFVGKYLLFFCVSYLRASCCCRFVLPGGAWGCSSPCCTGPVLPRFCEHVRYRSFGVVSILVISYLFRLHCHSLFPFLLVWPCCLAPSQSILLVRPACCRRFCCHHFLVHWCCFS